MRAWVFVAGLCVVGACERESSVAPVTRAPSSAPASLAEAPVVSPPFSVRGDAEGLLLVWFDASGPHTATRRSEIPEARRGDVRVDTLNPDPREERDPSQVFVADLREPAADGTFRVRRVPREIFDRAVEALAATAPGAPANAQTGATSSVVLYGASWCGACRSTAAWLREHHVDFVERDVERDAGAHDEMMAKARAQGLSPTGIPVVDFRGTVLLGFQPETMQRLLGVRAI